MSYTKRYVILLIPKQNIFKIISKLWTKYRINMLCKIWWVSISWYYKYRNSVLNNETKEDKDRLSIEKIKELCLKSKQKKWYRRITMSLKSEWVVMNHKKVLRIMRKYGFLAKIRKRNPYKQIMKATQEHRTAKNKLNRKFSWNSPYIKIWTDITYIKFKGKWTYLSIAKDMVTGEVISMALSKSLDLWIMDKTMHRLKLRYKNGELKWALFHSDQWFHYTHPRFWKHLKKLWCIQSMSRKWNCIDNAPTESFFWHMKDEIDISECKTFKALEKYLKNYIYYYNNNRQQWNKKKMTPVEYRNHLLVSKP